MTSIINMDKKPHGERIKVVNFFPKIIVNSSNFVHQLNSLVTGKVQLMDPVFLMVLLPAVSLFCILRIQYVSMKIF